MTSSSFLLGEKSEISEGLRKFRSRHEMSQEQFAVLAGVSLRTVQGLELQETRASSLTVLKIGDFLTKYERAARKAVA